MNYKIEIDTPSEIMGKIALRAKQLRLHYNLKRATLAQKSGVPESTIKRFETTGKISFESLLKIATALDCLDEFSTLFPSIHPTSINDIERLEKRNLKKRGRT